MGWKKAYTGTSEMQPRSFQIDQNLALYGAEAATALLAAGRENLSENGREQERKKRWRATVLWFHHQCHWIHVCLNRCAFWRYEMCFLFFFFWSHFGTNFVSLCIHKRESWLTTVFLTSLSGTVSWCGPPTCDLRSHLNPLTHWNYSSHFHLCFCICFGTTNVRTTYHLTVYKGFSQVLYHITSTLQMRKLRTRELKRPCAQGHTVNRCGLQPRASGPQECVLSYTPVGDNEGVWGDAKNTLPLWTKYCVYCTQHSHLVASLHVPIALIFCLEQQLSNKCPVVSRIQKQP